MIQRHKGFSLIEVAIAMVIFVIGALAILRIFPTGISLVEKSGNQQLASNSSRSVLARLSNEDAFPDATVNIDPAITTPGLMSWKPYDGSVIGSSKYNRTLPKDVSAGQLLNSALDRYQGINGEKVTVKNGGLPSTSYVLTQFSIADAPQVFKEDSLENVTISNTGQLEFSNAVLKSGAVFTQPTGIETAANRTFYVTYRYKTSTANPRVIGVEDEPVYAGASGAVILVAGSNVVTGPVEVRVKEPVSVAPQPDELRLGLLRLTDTLPTGQQLSIDYTTDWYWVLETLTPTSADDVFKRREPGPNDDLIPDPDDSHKNNYRQVELPIPFVQGRTSQRYSTLVMANGGIGQHFIWNNNGSTLPPSSATLVRVPMIGEDDADAANDKVDYLNYRNTLREGKLGFDLTNPADTGPNPAALVSPVIRVAYRTQDGWARQLSVSAKSYKPYNGTTLVERWRDYYQDGNTLYFQASEAGKAVKVTYNYGNPGADASGDLVKTELLTIGSNIQLGNQLGSPPSATGDLPLVTLSIAPETGSVTSIISIKGVSVTARTAWLTNDKYNQSLVTSMRGDS